VVTKEEALKLALEELAVRFSEGWHEGIKIDASDIMLLNDAAQALVQPAQEGECPNLKNCKGACFVCEYWNSETGEMEYPPAAQPAQEPLFLLHTGDIDSNGEQNDWESEADSGVRVDEFCAQHPNKTFGLYTTPPQRPWVDLTEDEVKHMLELFVIPPHHVEMVVQAIEAKLKEKNT